MNSDFIIQPPHPETEWSACTGYSESAVMIERILDVPLKDASICTGQKLVCLRHGPYQDMGKITADGQDASLFETGLCIGFTAMARLPE
jgi:hypothetical protein